MHWEKLYSMQKKLDDYILENHGLIGGNLFDKKLLAFFVELGELANETRCFKYWSKKKPSEKETILAEYVDGIHFLLSLGLEKGLRFYGTEEKVAEKDVTRQFNTVFKAAVTFQQNPNEQSYVYLFQHYIHLGELLGFMLQEIYEAYLKKNEINYERQDTGY